MAKLFIKQAKQYAEIRPDYPLELFEFIASKTPTHQLVWDVATGSGQAAQSLARLYDKVIATDPNPKLLELAHHLPNVKYQHTSPTMSISELEKMVSTKSSVDLITIAQGLHWFDLPCFYQQAKWILKKPNGMIAAWCYTNPQVNDSVDVTLGRFYNIDSGPYWDSGLNLIDDHYKTIDFPFEPLNGEDDTGPFEFVAEKEMDFEGYLAYLKSWSAYQTAKDQGVELLNDDVVNKFRSGWGGDEDNKKVVKFPIYIRMGRVGEANDS
ncbi:hypothetical protein ACFE04_031152 [Oxalis oulophora]